MSTVASYVQQREGEFFVGDSGVTLHSIIANWQRGVGPERLQEAFPSLPLVAIYGAITYYLEHRDELDAHFRETAELLAAQQAQAESQHPEFFADMRARLGPHRAQRDAGWPQQPPS
ncbi:MAG: hypothetical protein PVSMB4_02780 [Ktedonobacterales bacterium]